MVSCVFFIQSDIIISLVSCFNWGDQALLQIGCTLGSWESHNVRERLVILVWTFSCLLRAESWTTPTSFNKPKTYPLCTIHFISESNLGIFTQYNCDMISDYVVELPPTFARLYKEMFYNTYIYRNQIHKIVQSQWSIISLGYRNRY